MTQAESKAFLKMKRKMVREAGRACNAFIDAARAVFPAREHELISICYWAGFYCIRLPDKVVVIERGEVPLYIDWLPQYAAARAATLDQGATSRQWPALQRSPFAPATEAVPGRPQQVPL